jgi:hypothetical protein
MTVAELIEKLSQLENQEAIVMASGYEGGYDDINLDFQEVDMALDVNREWYYGKHELAEGLYGKYEVVKAIIL